MKLRTLLALAVCCAATLSQPSPLSAATYKNPIIAEDAPDPSIIKGNDGYYYLLSTAEHVYRSTDLVNWTYVRQAFGNNPRQTFVEGVNVYWAPCVTKQDGRYVLYFALSKWGGEDTASIGVATSDNPGGPYKLVGDGKLFTSAEVGVKNSIDPNYIEEDGHKYIVWGSWHGIWLIELTEDGLAVKDMSKKTQIAGTRFEAPYIFKRGHYYYLFCSIGACCEGANSTYETVVGRSTKLFGPYVNKNNDRMLDNNYSIFLTKNAPCIAPGHNSRILEDEAGKTWMTYHGYMSDDPDKGRVVWLDEVKWRSGWPYITGNGASSTELEGPTVAPFSLDVDEIHAEWGVEQGTIVPVDLTNDGQTSLVVAGQRTEKSVVTTWNTILRKNEEGLWETVQGGLQHGPNPTIVPADLNGDGQLELFVVSTPHETTNPDGAANGIYTVQPDGALQLVTAQVDGADFATLTAATVADANADGCPDIIAVGPQGQNLLLLASASGSKSGFAFRAQPFAGTETTYAQVCAADFNGDGSIDLFAYSTEAAELFLNDGAGNFQPTDWAAANPVPTDGGVAVSDVNYDSALDIVVVAAQATLCLNDGEGHFKPSTDSDLTMDYQNQNVSSTAASLFDWDGDGYADFLYQGASTALAVTTGALWLGTRRGTFSHYRRFAAGAAAATTFMDWNGNGAPDLVTVGSTTDTHHFPAAGNYLAVTTNPSASRHLTALSGLQSEVEGNVVHLSWNRGLKQQTYEVFVKDDQGRLYGNVRAHIEGDLAGRRKVLDQGNVGTAIQTSLVLPKGHYTWGVQRVNARYEGSPFATAEFTITADGVDELPISQNLQNATPVRYNVLGQRVPATHRGLQLLHYPSGNVRKALTK